LYCEKVKYGKRNKEIKLTHLRQRVKDGEIPFNFIIFVIDLYRFLIKMTLIVQLMMFSHCHFINSISYIYGGFVVLLLW